MCEHTLNEEVMQTYYVPNKEIPKNLQIINFEFLIKTILLDNLASN